MAIFPGEPGLAGFIEAKDDRSGGDNWSYKTCKAPVKSSSPTNQHPAIYRPDAHPVAQPTVSQHRNEITLCTHEHNFQPHLLFTYLSLHSLRVAEIPDTRLLTLY